MKHLCKFFLAILIMAGIMSCSRIGTMSVMKRHYRDGYYVSSQMSKKNIVQKNNDEIKSELEISLRGNDFCFQLADEKKVPAPHGRAAGKELDEAGKKLPIEISGTENEVNHGSKEAAGKVKIKPAVNKINFHAGKALKMVKHAIAKSRANLHASTASWEIANLLWIVAIVIVVLWLLAFLSGGWGMGGLINLLLLVALILFVIWLIKVL